jgi:hypothetical protein
MSWNGALYVVLAAVARDAHISSSNQVGTFYDAAGGQAAQGRLGPILSKKFFAFASRPCAVSFFAEYVSERRYPHSLQ